MDSIAILPEYRYNESIAGSGNGNGGKPLREIYEGASHMPPAGNEMYARIKNFYAELEEKKNVNGLELAAWTHAEFVRIHPFADGNGRTSGLLMNYQLLRKGFLPVSIAKENRLEYYNALDKYAAQGELKDFMELIAGLEKNRLDKYLAHMHMMEDATDNIC